MEKAAPRCPARRSSRSYHYCLGIKFEHFEVESVPDALEVRLPSLFSNQHHHQLAGVLVLFDQRGNEFEVVAIKRGVDVYLTQGWRQVGRCLGLRDGGWVRMIYVGGNRVFVEGRDRLSNTPLCLAPPKIISLNAEPRVVSSSDNVVPSIDPSVYVGRKPTVVMSFYGTLSRAVITTPFLHLPCDFCTCLACCLLVMLILLLLGKTARLGRVALYFHSVLEIGILSFDKHDHLNVEFVTSAANIRAASFGIPLQSLFETKGIAGKIVHVVATTNAVIAGLIVIEAIKVQQIGIRSYRGNILFCSKSV